MTLSGGACVAVDVAPVMARVTDRLLLVAPGVSARVDEALAAFAVTRTGWAVLRVLDSAEHLTSARLALACGVSRSRLTAVVDALCSAKLVSRQHPPGNRRTVQVCLTERGHQQLGAITTAVASALAQLYRAVDPQELAALDQTLTTLQHRLST